LLIDVRSPDVYAADHIPGAVSIPAPTLARHLDQIRHNPESVIYCNDSRLTRFAEQTLHKAGVRSFLHLEGGFFAWRTAGFATEQSLP